MQVTRAAFQAVASLNEQATDPECHTPINNFYTRISLLSLSAIPMVDSNRDPIGSLQLPYLFSLYYSEGSIMLAAQNLF